MQQIVTFFPDETQTDIFTQGSANNEDWTVLVHKGVYDTKILRTKAKSWGVEGAKDRIVSNAVRDTIRHMINARDTKGGHYDSKTMNAVYNLRARLKMLGVSSDNVKLRNDVVRLKIVETLEEIKPGKQNKFYRNYSLGLEGLKWFVDEYTLSNQFKKS